MGTTEILFVSIMGAIILFIAVLYFVNSIKIRKKTKKTEKREEKKTEEKVEVKPEITTEKPLEKAIKEANVDFHIKEAFEKIEQEKVEYEEKVKTQRNVIGGKLQLDRGDFKTELQKTLEQNGTYERNVISSDTNKLKSETAKMDYEVNTESNSNILDYEKKIADEYMNSQEKKSKTLQEEIEDMSPEAKSLLINDLLGKKY